MRLTEALIQIILAHSKPYVKLLKAKIVKKPLFYKGF